MAIRVEPPSHVALLVQQPAWPPSPMPSFTQRLDVSPANPQVTTTHLLQPPMSTVLPGLRLGSEVSTNPLPPLGTYDAACTVPVAAEYPMPVHVHTAGSEAGKWVDFNDTGSSMRTSRMDIHATSDHALSEHAMPSSSAGGVLLEERPVPPVLKLTLAWKPTEEQLQHSWFTSAGLMPLDAGESMLRGEVLRVDDADPGPATREAEEADKGSISQFLVTVARHYGPRLRLSSKFCPDGGFGSSSASTKRAPSTLSQAMPTVEEVFMLARRFWPEQARDLSTLELVADGRTFKYGDAQCLSVNALQATIVLAPQGWKKVPTKAEVIGRWWSSKLSACQQGFNSLATRLQRSRNEVAAQPAPQPAPHSAQPSVHSEAAFTPLGAYAVSTPRSSFVPPPTPTTAQFP